MYMIWTHQAEKEMNGEFHEKVKPFWNNLPLRSPSRFSDAANGWPTRNPCSDYLHQILGMFPDYWESNCNHVPSGYFKIAIENGHL